MSLKTVDEDILEKQEKIQEMLNDLMSGRNERFDETN
jgi:hypothetical protein